MAGMYMLYLVSNGNMLVFNIYLGMYHIPNKEYLNVQYFNDLVTGKKLAAKREGQIVRIKVAKYRELNTRFALTCC